MKHGKKYVDGAKLIDRSKLYDVNEALELAVKTGTAKFDESVEVHVKLALTAAMRISRSAAPSFCPTAPARMCASWQSARATPRRMPRQPALSLSAAEDMIQKIQNENWMDFDVLITTPDMMGLVGRLGRVLGPRGLMPTEGRHRDARDRQGHHRGQGR